MNASEVAETTAIKTDSTTLQQKETAPPVNHDNADSSATESLSDTAYSTSETKSNTFSKVIETTPNLNDSNHKTDTSSVDILSTDASFTDTTPSAIDSTNFGAISTASVDSDTSLDVISSTASSIFNIDDLTLDNNHKTDPAVTETKSITSTKTINQQTDSSTDGNIEKVTLQFSDYSKSNIKVTTPSDGLETITNTKEQNTVADYSSDVIITTTLSKIEDLTVVYSGLVNKTSSETNAADTENTTVYVSTKSSTDSILDIATASGVTYDDIIEHSGTPLNDSYNTSNFSTATDLNIIKFDSTTESTKKLADPLLNQNSSDSVTETVLDSNLLINTSTTTVASDQTTFTTVHLTTQTIPASLSENALVEQIMSTSGSLYSESLDAETSSVFPSPEAYTSVQDFFKYNDTSSNSNAIITITNSSTEPTSTSKITTTDYQNLNLTSSADSLTLSESTENDSLQDASEAPTHTDPTPLLDFTSEKTDIAISINNSTDLPTITSQGNLLIKSHLVLYLSTKAIVKY